MKIECSEQVKKQILLGLFLGLLILAVSLIFIIWIGLVGLLANQETEDLIKDNDHATRIIAYFLLSLAVVMASLGYIGVMIIGQIYILVFPKAQQNKDSENKK